MSDISLPVREGMLVDVEQLRAGDVARLHGSRCDECGSMEFPGRVDCPWCGGRPSTPAPLGPEAVLVGYTAVLHPAPGSLVEAPYDIGVARFAGGLDVIGLLETPVDVALGDPIEVCAVEVPDGRLTYSFRRADGAPAMR